MGEFAGPADRPGAGDGRDALRRRRGRQRRLPGGNLDALDRPLDDRRGERHARGYHSVSTLLPNGAVLTGGGGAPGQQDNLDAEIYYPAYLFARGGNGSVLAARPRIVSLSAVTTGFGQAIDVQTATGDDVREVSLIAVGSVTHSFDSNQRRMTLPFTASGNGIKVTMPASGNLAPPGYYQLSIVNRAGVPSRGVIVAIGAAAPAAPNAAPATTPTTATPYAKQIGDEHRHDRRGVGRHAGDGQRPQPDVGVEDGRQLDDAAGPVRRRGRNRQTAITGSGPTGPCIAGMAAAGATSDAMRRR
ncbi:galactose oxidase early set domain-containing protein [Sphingomonas sp. MMS24-JH45]